MSRLSPGRADAVPEPFSSGMEYLRFLDIDLPAEIAVKTMARALKYLKQDNPARLLAELRLAQDQYVFLHLEIQNHGERNSARPKRAAYDDDATHQDAVDTYEVYQDEIRALNMMSSIARGVQRTLRRVYLAWIINGAAGYMRPMDTPSLSRSERDFLTAFKTLAGRALSGLQESSEDIIVDPKDPAGTPEIVEAAALLLRQIARADGGQPSKGAFWAAIAKQAADNVQDVPGDSARMALTKPRFNVPYARVEISQTDDLNVIAARLLFVVLVLDAASPDWDKDPDDDDDTLDLGE